MEGLEIRNMAHVSTFADDELQTFGGYVTPVFPATYRMVVSDARIKRGETYN